MAVIATVHLAQPVLEVLLMGGQLLGLARHLIEVLGGFLLLHAAHEILGFVQTFGGPALSRRALLGASALLAGRGFAHIVGRLSQPF